MLADNPSTEETSTATTEETISTDSGENTPSWYYQAPSDDFEGIAGQGDVPDWFRVDKYKSIDQQAKAYKELEQRFGGFTGAPEEYEFADGIDAERMDQGLVDIFKEVGAQYHMNNDMFNETLSKVQEYYMKQEEEYQEQQMQQLGPDAQARLSNIKDWINGNLPPDVVAKAINVGISADAIEVFEAMISKSKSQPMASNKPAQEAPKMTQAEYAAMLNERDAHGNLKVSVDKDYRRKMDEIAKQFT